MTLDKWQIVWKIYDQALSLPPQDRKRFVDMAAADTALRDEVLDLLETASVADSGPNAAISGGPGRVGTAVAEGGTYQVMEKLGEGGMGIVYRARQTRPMEREVALKMIRPGAATPQLMARFDTERQSLAKMDHPSIARVLDAGTAEGGQPFFVMELVNGLPITKYCEQRQVPLRARLELMIALCSALQHAHQKGIIHRDIKPSNVLVTETHGAPVPKVIDFGIAKMVDGEDGLTRTGAVIGTFNYASPEQVELGPRDIDTRTDVYSLGALFYEMVTGTPPLSGLSIEQTSYSEILRRIREEIPPPPSRRGGALALPRELDWILLKALEKDRERRYPTTDSLGLDLRRLTDGEPVEAAPPSRGYRLWKFVAKHRVGIGAVAAMVILLVVAVGWMAFALSQQNRVKAQAAALREVVRKTVLERPSQWKELQANTKLRFDLMSDAESALSVLSGDNGGDAALQIDLAKSYAALGATRGSYGAAGSVGDTRNAIADFEKALAFWDAVAKRQPQSVEVLRGRLDTAVNLVFLRRRMGELEKAEATGWGVVRDVDALPGALREQLVTRWHLSAVYKEIGMVRAFQDKGGDALHFHRKAVQTFEAGMPPQLLDNVTYREHLAGLKKELATSAWTWEGYTPSAEAEIRDAAKLVEGVTGTLRGRHADMQAYWGNMQAVAGDRASGLRNQRVALAELEEAQAADPGNSVLLHWGGFARNHLAMSLATRGTVAEAGEAIRLEEKNIEIRRRLREQRQQSPSRSAHYEGMDRCVYAQALWAAGRKSEALRQLELAMKVAIENRLEEIQWAVERLKAAFSPVGSPARLDASKRALAVARKLVRRDYYGELRWQATAFTFAEDALAAGDAASRAEALQLADDHVKARQLKVAGHIGPLSLKPPPSGGWERIRTRLAMQR